MSSSTQSRLSVFTDENRVLGLFPTAELRAAKRVPVLCELGANNQVNRIIKSSENTNACQPQNIPGFYDRKPLYARGPAKLGKENNDENLPQKGRNHGGTCLPLDNLLCDNLTTEKQLANLLPSIDSPMAVSPLVRESYVPALLPKSRHETEEQLLDDRFFTSQYGDSHYHHLRIVEVKLRPYVFYLRRQKDLSADMRSVLVDWLVEVNEEYQLSDEALFITVSLIDRFLSHMSVVRNKLQLVGTAAVLIAAKVEEIYPPQLSDLVFITDDTYTQSQIIRMEALLLRTLDFFVGNAHALTFIQLFGIKANVTKRVAHLAQYICELSLLTTDALVFLPSELGAAGLILAMHHIEGSIHQWTGELHEFSGIPSTQLQSAVNFLQGVLLEANSSPHKAIRNKFAHKKYSSVSLLPMRAIAPRVLNV